MNGKCRSFPFQFEDNHSRIMASCKNIKRWMWGHHPKSIMFSAEGMETSTFGHIPNTNRLVLRIRHNQILSRMKDHTRHIVVMSTTCVNFPRLWKNWENCEWFLLSLQLHLWYVIISMLMVNKGSCEVLPCLLWVDLMWGGSVLLCKQYYACVAITLGLFVLEGYLQVLFACYSSPLPRGIIDYADDLTN